MLFLDTMWHLLANFLWPCWAIDKALQVENLIWFGGCIDTVTAGIADAILHGQKQSPRLCQAVLGLIESLCQPCGDRAFRGRAPLIKFVLRGSHYIAPPTALFNSIWTQWISVGFATRGESECVILAQMLQGKTSTRGWRFVFLNNSLSHREIVFLYNV